MKGLGWVGVWAGNCIFLPWAFLLLLVSFFFCFGGLGAGWVDMERQAGGERRGIGVVV